MSGVTLTGRLVCASVGEAETVVRLLPRHVQSTRAEPGCLSFDVERTTDPLVWSVSERFTDREAFEAHQARVAASEWGRETAGIRRDYIITAGWDDGGQGRGADVTPLVS